MGNQSILIVDCLAFYTYNLTGLIIIVIGHIRLTSETLFVIRFAGKAIVARDYDVFGAKI